jgi:hypothetical protein
MTNDTPERREKPPLIDRVRLGSEIGKDVFSLLRDASIFLLIVVVAADPAVIRRWMSSNQVDKLNLGLVELTASKEQAISAVDASADAQKSAADAIHQLEQLGRADPALASRLDPILKSLKATEQAATDANKNAASAAATQQQILPELKGWVSINFLNANGGFAVGRTATVIPPRSLNLRSAPGSNSEIMGGLAPGTRVLILEGPVGAWVRVKSERTT